MKKILIAIPFENIFPPMNGGMLRAFNLLIQLSKYFEITAIINQDKESFCMARGRFPTLEKCTIISTAGSRQGIDLFSLLPSKFRNAFRYRYWNRSLKGPAETSFLMMYPILKSLLRKREFDYVVLEDMGLLNIAKLIRRYGSNARIIYDAHNVNSGLAEVAFSNGEISRGNYKLVKRYETSIYKMVDGIFACSEKDLSALIQLNERKIKGTVIPNGVVLPLVLSDEGVRKDTPEYIMFCGSLDYEPNREGLLWFYKAIWPLIREELPYLKLIVVGSGIIPEELEILKKDDSILFKGRVANVEPFYNLAAASIVPLKTGSGTRLKILEAMALGVPVISTSTGAEGIAYTHNRDIVIADEEKKFAEELINVLRSKGKRLELQKNSRLLVEEKYDWDEIGKKVKGIIENGSF